jgi:alkylation response protein AidB-like acyl-CoA dehydrogenase
VVQLLAETAHRAITHFIRECVNPGAEERDARAVECPPELMRRAREIGLFTYALPTELGGQGADLLEWGSVLEEVGYLSEDCSFPALLSARVWVTDTLFATGRQDLIERYVRPMAEAKLFGAFAYSDAADPFAFSSTVSRDGNSLVVNGEKPIVTGATTADVFVVFLNDEATGDLAVVLIERSDNGVEIEPVQSLGVRGLGLGALRMRDVCVPADRQVVPSDGLTYAQRMLNARRVLLVAPLTGAMRAVHQYCIEHLSRTYRYGTPLIDMQNVQAALGRQFIAVESSRAILHRALSRLAGRTSGFDPAFDPFISAAKHQITTHAVDLALSALRLLGGRGYLRGPVERFLRDSCSLLAAGGAQDVLEIDLGARAATELPTREGKL